MTLVLADRVKETTTSTGTTAVTLLGATTGFQSFSAVGNGNTTFYTISAQSGTAWEVGVGTYTAAGTTLSRDTVLASSNSGSLVNFTAGTKDVFVTYPAERAIYSNTAGTTNYVSKFTSSTAIGNSLIYDNGTNVGIGTSSPAALLNVYKSAGSMVIIESGDSYNATLKLKNSISEYSFTPHGAGTGALLFYDNTNGQSFYSYKKTVGHNWYINNSYAMILDSSGNVGIGTSSPTNKLSLTTSTFANSNVYVQDINYLTYPVLKFGYIGSGGSISAGLLDSAAYPMALATGGTERLRIDSSGNVLVGQTSTGANGKLQVTGNIGLTGDSYIRQSTNSDGYYLKVLATQLVAGSSNSYSYSYSGGSQIASISAGDYDVLFDAGRATSTDGRVKVRNTASANTALTVEKNGVYTFYASTTGNVGIGTSSPNAQFHVSGGGSGSVLGYASNALITQTDSYSWGLAIQNATAGSNYALLNFVGDDGSTYITSGTGDGGYISNFAYDPASNLLQIYGGLTLNLFASDATNVTGQNYVTINTSGTERMRINSSGNVGIGTASPTTKLDVNGTTRFGATGADTITLRGQVSANSSVGTSGQVLTSQGANLPPQWTTPTSGTVTSVTATSPVASSGGTTPVISLPAATTSVSGYLTSTDWNTFNSKGSGTVTGTGTTNYLPKFTGTSAIGNSLIYDNGYAIGINTANPIAALTATISGCSGFFQKTVSSPQLTAVPVLPKNPTVCIVGDSASNENYNASLGLVTTGVATGSTRPSEIYLTSTRSTNAQLNASTFTPLLAGDSIGQIKFCGDNGVNLRQFGASINAIANTNWSSTNWDGYLMFSTTSTGGSVPAERMRIDSSGNVGIGTSSPIGNLNVYGTSGTTIRVSDGTNTNWRGYVLGASGGDSNEYGYLKLNANTGELRLYVGPNTYGGFQTFYTYGSERMRIDGSGNLGVGTSSPAAKLHVVGAIYATGNITAYYSDDRLKTRKGNIENALDKVLSLDGFHYEANETAQALGYKAKPEVGLSAQQVQAVLPEVVVPAPIDEKYLTVHYERLIPLLVEAMKEQQAQIEELRATISLLRGDIR